MPPLTRRARSTLAMSTDTRGNSIPQTNDSHAHKSPTTTTRKRATANTRTKQGEPTIARSSQLATAASASKTNNNGVSAAVGRKRKAFAEAEEEKEGKNTRARTRATRGAEEEELRSLSAPQTRKTTRNQKSATLTSSTPHAASEAPPQRRGRGVRVVMVDGEGEGGAGDPSLDGNGSSGRAAGRDGAPTSSRSNSGNGSGDLEDWCSEPGWEDWRIDVRARAKQRSKVERRSDPVYGSDFNYDKRYTFGEYHNEDGLFEPDEWRCVVDEMKEDAHAEDLWRKGVLRKVNHQGADETRAGTCPGGGGARYVIGEECKWLVHDRPRVCELHTYMKLVEGMKPAFGWEPVSELQRIEQNRQLWSKICPPDRRPSIYSLNK